MAGVCNPGLAYYVTKTNGFSDPAIKLLTRQHPRGWELYSRIIESIFGIKGYYIHWNRKEQKEIALTMGLTTLNQVAEIIETCLEESLFDRGIYNKFGILTSKAIQESFITASASKKHIKIVKDWALFDPMYFSPSKPTRGKKRAATSLKAYYQIFDNIELIFSDDQEKLVDNWERFETLERITAPVIAGEPVAVPDEEPAEEPNLKPVYGTKSSTINKDTFQREKEVFMNNTEMMDEFCKRYNMTNFNQQEKKLEPDFTKVKPLMEEYISEMEVRGDYKHAAALRTHFSSWYNYRQQSAAEKKGAKIARMEKKPRIHLDENIDYENQQNWKPK
jgi:hypothetical protein